MTDDIKVESLLNVICPMYGLILQSISAALPMDEHLEAGSKITSLFFCLFFFHTLSYPYSLLLFPPFSFPPLHSQNTLHKPDIIIAQPKSDIRLFPFPSCFLFPPVLHPFPLPMHTYIGPTLYYMHTYIYTL